MEVVHIGAPPLPRGPDHGADGVKQGRGHLEEPVEEGLAELLPPALGVEEVEEHDTSDEERDKVEDELAKRVAPEVVPLAVVDLLLLLLLVILLGRGRLEGAHLLFGPFVDVNLEGELLVRPDIGVVLDEHLVLVHALLGRQELERHRLHRVVGHQLGVVDEPVRFAVHEHDHPRLGALKRVVGRVHHTRRRARGEPALTAACACSRQLPPPLLLCKPKLAVLLEELLLARLALLLVVDLGQLRLDVLVAHGLGVEDRVVLLVLVRLARVVAGVVLAVHSHSQVDDVFLIDALLVLHLPLDLHLHVRHVVDDGLDVLGLLGAEVLHEVRLLLVVVLELRNRVDRCLVLVEHAHLAVGQVGQLLEHCVRVIEPDGLREVLGKLEDVARGCDEALVDGDVEQAL
mmetsp:Transcript_7053/g.17422  ORF Transcript_7053/g.17422 Transcript_7053/m.17422 type:complete len:402 (+) Transcript_7053:680-1885(+)